MKRPLALLLLLAAAVGLTACGQSSEDKAKSQVCDARADISKNVNELTGLTLATASVDGVKKNVQAIQDDLGKIKETARATSRGPASSRSRRPTRRSRSR